MKEILKKYFVVDGAEFTIGSYDNADKAIKNMPRDDETLVDEETLAMMLYKVEKPHFHSCDLDKGNWYANNITQLLYYEKLNEFNEVSWMVYSHDGKLFATYSPTDYEFYLMDFFCEYYVESYSEDKLYEELLSDVSNPIIKNSHVDVISKYSRGYISPEFVYKIRSKKSK